MSEDSDTTGATMTDIVRALRATLFVIRQGLYDPNGER